MNELALFAGAGGGILGGLLLGWRTVCAVEIEDYPRRVLLQRQAEAILPRFPIWDDIRTFDGNPWRGKVDIITGGFPCQDISCAGKGAGLEGEKSSLWWEMHRVIGEVRPAYVFAENSPALIVRGLRNVIGSLADLGYVVKWGVVSAADAGAWHIRKRIWIYGYSHNNGKSACSKHDEASRMQENVANSKLQEEIRKESGKEERTWTGSVVRWETEPKLDRVVHGMANRLDRLKAIGNGQVPQAMALAWQLLGG